LLKSAESATYISPGRTGGLIGRFCPMGSGSPGKEVVKVLSAEGATYNLCNGTIACVPPAR